MSTTNRKKKTVQPAQKNKGQGNALSQKKGGNAKSPFEPRPLFGAHVKNDLFGVVIGIIAIVLLTIVLLPEDAIGARILSEALHLIFGTGAILLPFLMLGWAVSFFIKKRLMNSPLRLAIGLAIIFLGIVAIFAFFTPQAQSDPGRIFESSLLIKHGGYVGGGIAWALLSFVGPVATMVVLVGFILIGLVLIGLSITGLVEWFIKRIKALGKKDEALEGFSLLRDEYDASSKSGGAYQMGPHEARGSASLNRRSLGRDAAFQATKVLGSAAPLPDTLYQPDKDVQGKGYFENRQELGSTRRQRAQDQAQQQAATNAQTLLLSVDNEDEKALKSQAERTTLESEKTILLETSPKFDSAKKQHKQAASQDETARSALAAPHYVLPHMKVLRVSREKANTKAGSSELRSTANRLQETLEEFKVEGEVVGWIAGPTVTLYKISLGEGVRLNRITALQSDIQLALAAQAVRIVAPIPGTSLVGIEVPNQDRNQVLLGDVLDSARDTTLALAIGKDVEGEAIVADLALMPHLLIGGTTGSGKSVAINSIIMSLLMRTTPDEVRMIMIDPKRVELTLYNGIPHLYVPVVTDAGQAASALAWCVAEMDRRLKLFEKHAVKNIKQFNARVVQHLEALEKEHLQTSEEIELSESSAKESSDVLDTGEEHAADLCAAACKKEKKDDTIDIGVEQENLRAPLPYLVIIIDELADLMMLNGKEVESAISRLAQLARAAGLHLIVATQRPSTNVITGLIKANIVNRIAFTVASGIDSRVILDTPGAEDLIGLGDMLFSRPEYSKPIRVQGCLVSEAEIETVVEYWRGQGETDYHEEILQGSVSAGVTNGVMGGGDGLEDDPLIWEAAEIVVSSQLGSTSALQRRLKVGYARAGRIMDMLEMKGIVGPPNGSKPREVLLDDVLDIETLRAFE